MLSDAEAARLTREVESLRGRVARLEQRLNELEPETAPGIGRRSVPDTYYPQPESDSESPVIDAVADAFEALGFFGKNDG